MRGRAADRRQVRRTHPSRPTMGVPTRPRMPIRGAGALLCRLRGVVSTHAARRLFWHMLVVGRYHGEVGHQPPVVRPRMGHETTLRTHSPPRTARDGSTRAPLHTARGGLCSTVLHERRRQAGGALRVETLTAGRKAGGVKLSDYAPSRGTNRPPLSTPPRPKHPRKLHPFLWTSDLDEA